MPTNADDEMLVWYFILIRVCIMVCIAHIRYERDGRMGSTYTNIQGWMDKGSHTHTLEGSSRGAGGTIRGATVHSKNVCDIHADGNTLIQRATRLGQRRSSPKKDRII